MPRIPEPGIERQKSRVSVERLVEASGIELKGPWGQGALGSSLPFCLKPLHVLARGDDGDTGIAAHRQEIVLVTRGDEISLAGDGRSDDVIVMRVGGHDTRRVCW